MVSEIHIFLLAMTPLGEVRVAIPIGITFYKLNPGVVYLLSVLGNIFVVFLVLTFLDVFSRWISQKIRFFKFFLNWLFSKTRESHHEKIAKYGFYFLPFFVAIPLPISGGWTASLIAFVFGIPFKKAFPLISLGVLMAGLIVLILTLLGITIEKHFGWQVLLGLLLVAGFIWIMYNIIKSKKDEKI